MSDQPAPSNTDRLAECPTFAERGTHDASCYVSVCKTELAAARAEAEQLREALREWKCRSCNGRKVETCGCDKQVCYEWCRSGQPCKRCNASGLEPIARDALAEAAPEGDISS